MPLSSAQQAARMDQAGAVAIDGIHCPHCWVDREQQVGLKRSTCVSHSGIVSCSFCPDCGYKSSSTENSIAHRI